MEVNFIICLNMSNQISFYILPFTLKFIFIKQKIIVDKKLMNILIAVQGVC